jgi:hypothetical protein
MRNILAGVLIALLLSSSAQAALSLDGSSSNTGTTITLTTSDSNDVIIVLMKHTDNATMSVSDGASLTWAHRNSQNFGSSVQVDEFYAISPAPLVSDVITISGSTAGLASRVFGVNGANLVAPFDTNASIPNGNALNIGATSIAVATAVTTNSSNDFLFSYEGRNGGSGYGGSLVPWSGSSPLSTVGNFTSADYEIVSSTQASITPGYSWSGNSSYDAMLFDAVQGAPTTAATVAHVHGFAE